MLARQHKTEQSNVRNEWMKISHSHTHDNNRCKTQFLLKLIELNWIWLEWNCGMVCAVWTANCIFYLLFIAESVFKLLKLQSLLLLSVVDDDGMVTGGG